MANLLQRAISGVRIRTSRDFDGHQQPASRLLPTFAPVFSKLVVKQGMKLSLVGAGIGIAAAVAGGRVMQKLLFQVTATDPLIFAAVLVHAIDDCISRMLRSQMFSQSFAAFADVLPAHLPELKPLGYCASTPHPLRGC